MVLLSGYCCVSSTVVVKLFFFLSLVFEWVEWRDFVIILARWRAKKHLWKREKKRMGIIIQSVFGRRQDTLHVLLVVSERIVWKMIGLYIKYEADNLPPVLSSFGRGVVDVCLVFSSSYRRTVYILFFSLFLLLHHILFVPAEQARRDRTEIFFFLPSWIHNQKRPSQFHLQYDIVGDDLLMFFHWQLRKLGGGWRVLGVNVLTPLTRNVVSFLVHVPSFFYMSRIYIRSSSPYFASFYQAPCWWVMISRGGRTVF